MPGLASSSGPSGSNNSGNNLRGLIHYDDSDDDLSIKGEEESCVSSAGETANDGTKKIDLEVADFLKEIDAMTSNDGQDSSEAEAKESENDDRVPSLHTTSDREKSNTSEPEPCYWQQCYDETSGYTYFWHIQTNEVTWESPEEYKAYLERVRLNEMVSNNSAAPHSDHLYTTNGEASTSSAGRVVPNGTNATKNCSKPPKKRLHNVEEGKIEPISFFGPASSDSSDDENQISKAKKKKLSEEVTLQVHYGPYLPEPTAPTINEARSLSPDLRPSQEAVVERAVGESSCPSSSSNRSEDKVECAMDLTRTLVTQSRESDDRSPQIQVGNVSDSEVQAIEESLENDVDFLVNNDASVSQPSTSTEGCHLHQSDHSCSSVTNEDEPDSTCTSKIERHIKKSKTSRHVGSPLPQSLQFITQYEISENESDAETPAPSPLENSSKLSPPSIQIELPTDAISENPESNQASNSSSLDNDSIAVPVFIEENSNNCVSDSDARVVPVSFVAERNSSPEEQPSASQDEEIDLDEIEKELDRALERKVGENLRHDDSPAPSQRENAEVNLNAQLPRGNSPENIPSLSHESLELLSNDIIGKLELLTTNRAQMPLLSTLLIMVDVRLTDWRNGVLPSQYFMDRLAEANDVLRQYERSAVPTGWICNWDRDERRYFYTHVETGRSQTEFPVETPNNNDANTAGEDNLEPSVNSSDLPAVNSSEPQTSITYKSILVGKHSSAGQHPVVTSSTAEGLFRAVAKRSNRIGGSQMQNVQSGEASCSFRSSVEPPIATSQRNEHILSPSPIARVLTPPPEIIVPPPPITPPPPPATPPPPIPSPPRSPPPPPPDSTEVGDNEVREISMPIHRNFPTEIYPASSSSHHIMVQPTCPIPPLVPVSIPMMGPLNNHGIPNALEQEQMAFYESLGNSWMAQPTVGGEVSPAGVIIVRPPLANGLEVPAYAASPLPWPIMAQPPAEPFFYIPPEANGAMNLEANAVPPSMNIEPEEAANAALAESHNDPLMALPAGPSNAAGPSNENSNLSKKDKKKSKLATGLSLKKKNISSLVQKWKKIKQEQLREEEEVEGRKNTDQDGKISTTM